MPYAVTLHLDPVAATHVERMWRALAERAGDDEALRLYYPPHVTLAVLPDDTPAAAIETAVFRAAASWDALVVVFSGIGVFPGPPPVIWAAPVVTEDLLARHRTLHAALAPLPVHSHYLPGAWVPHVTLGGQGPASAAVAIEAALSAWEGPVTGRLDRLELVRFHPVAVVRSEALLQAVRK